MPQKGAAMLTTVRSQETLTIDLLSLSRWIDGFLLSRRAGGKTPGTVAFYKKRLTHFTAYCAARNLTTLEAIDAGLIREWLIHVADSHNPGGAHGYFRALKAFFLWYEAEAEPDGWRNPIRKVTAPKVPEKILEPVPLADVGALVRACRAGREGARDKAILLTLLDTGARATELTGFDLADLNPVTGELVIRKGKGGKTRTVFLGNAARKAVRAWLKERGAQAGALFCLEAGGRLSYGGLRGLVRRRAADAGIVCPSLHSFRRACAIALLRGGADLLTLQRILGHADLSILKRYAKQNTDDLRAVHNAASPVDGMGL